MATERERLLVQLHETEDPNKANAIERRIKSIDKAQVEKQGKKVTEALSWAQRKLKYQMSGDEERWFPEGAETTLGSSAYNAAAPLPALSKEKKEGVSNAAGLIADIALDPLNLVGGPLASGGKSLPGAIASISNYIPNWYSPSVASKGTGAVGWFGDVVKSVGEHVLDPRSRALWNEQKITKPAQGRIAGRDPTDTRSVEKDVSQVQFTSGHIPNQTGVAQSDNPAAKEILDRSFLTDSVKNEKGSLSQALQDQSVKVDEGFNARGKVLSPKDKEWATAPKLAPTSGEADFVEKWLGQQPAYKGTYNYRLKSPTAKETGGHHNDVVYKNPAKKALGDAFKNMMDADGNVNIKQLYGWLEENKGKYNKDLQATGRTRDSWSVVNSSAEHVAKNGLWLSGSRLGSAITEGGVSWLMKMEKDGTMKVFMMDKHDFAEKIPGVAAMVPEDMVAITPMMVNNIKNVGGGTQKAITAPLRDEGGNIIKEGRKHTKKTHGAPKAFQQTARRGTSAPYKGLLEEYTRAQPTARGTARETRRLAGEGLLAQRFYANTSREDTK